MIVILKLSIGHHNKSYDYENKKSGQKPKFLVEKFNKVSKPFNHKLFSENFIYDPMYAFSNSLSHWELSILG